MRIIREGKLPSEPVEEEHQHTCAKCGTLFGFTAFDLKKDLFKVYLVCPFCQHRILLNDMNNQFRTGIFLPQMARLMCRYYEIQNS